MSKVKSNYEIISDKTQNPVTSTEYIKHGNEWLNDVINCNNNSKWVSESCFEPYAFDADSIGTDFYPQGMCKCTYNNKECIAQGYIKGDYSQQKVVIMDFASGTKYKTKTFDSLGHINSLTWDGTHIYVATSGGTSETNKIVKLDTNLNAVNTYNIDTYAVAYNAGKIYALGSSSALMIINATNMSIDKTVTTNIGFRGYTTYQGIACDGNYLYIPNSKWYSADTNKSTNKFGEFIDVYDLNGTFVHSITINLTFENEEIDFFDGCAIAVCNTGGTANYFRIAIYNDEVGKFKSHGIKEYGLLGVNISSETYNVYVKENYTGWLMDGSESKPFYNIWIASRYVPVSVKVLKINLLSDITTNFRIHTTYHKGFTVDITGNNHKTNQDIYAEGVYSLVVRDLEFTGNPNISTDAALYIKGVSYAWINNVTFSGGFGTKKCLESIASNLTITKITLSGITSYGSSVIDTTEGGSLTINQLISDSDNYVLSSRVNDSKFPSITADNKMLIYTGNWDEPYMPNSFYSGVDIDLKLIRRPCRIRVPQSINVSNTPTGENGNPSVIDCNWITNTVYVLTLTYYYGEYEEVWEGYANTETDSIVWKMLENNKTVIGENLIPYPYYSKSDSSPAKGITRTINSDGTITFNGTSTGNTTGFYCANNISLSAGVYTFSGCPDLDGCQIRITTGDNTYDLNAGDESETFVLEEYADDVKIYPRITKADVTCENVVFRPMLERGKAAHKYQKYELSRQAIVDRVKSDETTIQENDNLFFAENLVEYPYAFEDRTVGGVSFAINDNGSIQTSGVDTSTARWVNVTNPDTPIYLEHKKYVLHGCPAGGSTSKYCLAVANPETERSMLRDTGNGITIDNTSGDYDSGIYITCVIYKGHDGSALNFEPQIEEGEKIHNWHLYTLSRAGMRKDIDALSALL